MRAAPKLAREIIFRKRISRRRVSFGRSAFVELVHRSEKATTRGENGCHMNELMHLPDARNTSI
jgi:hypothetical protein